MAAPCQYTISGTLYLPREGEFKINCIGFVNGSMKVRYIRDGRENYIDIDCTKIFEVRPKRFRLKKGILVKFSTPEGKSAEIRIRHVEGTTIDILIDAINNWRQIAIIRPLTQQLEEIKGAMAQFQARPTQEIEELKERLERLSRQINETTQQLPDLPADVRESLEQLREQVNQMGRVLTKREQTIEHIINAVSQLSNTMNAVLNQMQQILLQQQQLREEIVRRYERPVKLKGPVEISPLNMATTSPVALTSTVSMEVNASITGVKRTPPPIPAMTATIAINVLNKNEATTINHIPVGVRTFVASS